jgi:hypothetical protein
VTSGSSSVPGHVVTELSRAGRRIRSVAVVLSHLFDALSDPHRSKRPRGAGAQAELWSSVGDLLDDLAIDAQLITEEMDALTPAPAEPEVPTPATTGTKDVGARAVAPPSGQDDLNGAGTAGRVTPTTELAADLARTALDPSLDLGHIIEEHEDRWTDLVAAVRKRRFPRDDHGEQDDADSPMDLYTRLIATLPAELRRDFRRFAQSRAVEDIIERDAAFELGREIERRSQEVQRPRTRRREIPT